MPSLKLTMIEENTCSFPSHSHGKYDAKADMNDECKIDIRDIAIVAK